MSDSQHEGEVESRLKSIENTCNNMRGELYKMNSTLIRLTKTVEIHEKRSTKLEEEQQEFRDHLAKMNVLYHLLTKGTPILIALAGLLATLYRFNLV